MRRPLTPALLLLPLSLLAACAPDGVGPDTDAAADTGDAEAAALLRSALDPTLVARLDAGESVDVIFLLDDHDLQTELAQRRAAGPTDATADADLQRFAYAAWQESLAERLGADFTVQQTYENLPMLAGTLHGGAALDRALAGRRVLDVVAVQEYEAFDVESLALMNQPAAAAAGFRGQGIGVAVLDTGADFTHADLGACTAAGAAGCRVVYAADFAAQDNARDVGGHGTNVSAIVAKTAPGANILALDVFGSGGTASSTHIIAAIDWVISNKDAYNIRVINMSLGGGSSTTECSTDIFATAVAAARTAGISSIVATGNNAFTNKIASPACVPAAVRVGAVYDTNLGGMGWSSCTDSSTAADKVTCFSNSASFIHLLAPGAMATAGGYTMGGTSMAAPHAAGAFAVAAAAYPTDTPEQLLARVQATGDLVTDHRNGVTTPRVDIEALVAGAQAGDATAPTGTLSINSGAAGTRSATATLTISGTDDTGVTEMCVSNTSACTAWQAYATTRSWTLTTGAGTKTVTLFLRDAAGNVSTAITDTIVVDTTAPRNGTASAARGNAQNTVSWTGFSDAGAGIATYRLMASTTANPTNCTSGTPIYTGTETSFTHTGLTNGTTVYYRACAVDHAGNVSTGATTNAKPAPELNAPANASITLAADAEAVKGGTVAWTAAATDETSVSQICVGTSATSCTTWRTFTGAGTISLTSSGTKTVYAWLRDPWGNTSATPVSDSVIVDATAPVQGTASAAWSGTSATLSWAAATDAHTSVASYKVVYTTGSTDPASRCTNGTVLQASTSALTATLSSTNAGVGYRFRVCAVDAVGNVATGTVARLAAR